MASSRRVIGFINAGHVIDHMFMLIYPTAVLGMLAEFHRSYGEMIALALGGFIAFGSFSLPAGWLGDRWSRRNMMALFFLGIGAATLATGFAQSLLQVACGLAAIGMFAGIYHPVGTAMLVSHAEPSGRLGQAIGVNGVWGNLGVAFAALVTGATTQWLGWRCAFILPGIIGLITGIAYLALVPDEANQSRRSAATAARFPRTIVVRAFAVLVLVTLAGGMVFNATTVAFPKLIDERLPQLAGSTFGVGILVCAVYVVGALSQLLMGRIIDRHPLKIGFLGIALFQAPLLLLTAFTSGWLMVIAATVMIFTVFGQITFNEGMVARYASAEWRARVYAVRYMLSFGVSATAVPLVAYMHEHGGFTGLFELLAGFGALVLLGAGLFPLRRDEVAPVAAIEPVAQAAE
ncbi:MAG TPA: MFS transporter [Stellaceae bacterium]|jgi:MFS family permease|nr:MFS transporter [Stellaceae bacterium]